MSEILLNTLPTIHVLPHNTHMYNISTPQLWLESNTIKNGDLIVYENSYRGDGIYILINDKLTHILQDGAGYSFIIPKVLEYNLAADNKNINDIIKCYRLWVDVIIFPLSYQQNILKLTSNNMLEEVYGYDCAEEFEGVLNIDNGINEFNYTQIFEPDNYYEIVN